MELSENDSLDFHGEGMPPHPDKQNALLLEVAWEVANQVGGIFTVIRSKVPSMLEKWGDRYLLLGPYVHPQVTANFDPVEPPDTPFGRAVRKMRDLGFEVHYGRWLVDGMPRVVLFNPYNVFDRLGEIKYQLWEHHGISTPGDDSLINQVVAFGFMTKIFAQCMVDPEVNSSQRVILHVHEWMAGSGIPDLRKDKTPVSIVFTTHATLLGRYLAMNDPGFYDHLAFFDWEKEARYFNIETPIRLERAAAHGAHVFTTVSRVTALECEHLIGRVPDLMLPNGLNVKRFVISHELQNVHQKNKEEIHRFVTGHFFPSYPIDLDKTLYFFTSGRYEYQNKGYDLTLEALARLNWRMKEANIPITVVVFFITHRPYRSINPEVLESHRSLEKIREICADIEKQFGDALFSQTIRSTGSEFPDISEFITDYAKFRLRRSIQSWKATGLPKIVTHNLEDDGKDEILNFLRTANLLNQRENPVKIVYHPDFISSTNPLWNIDYADFVRGTHLGIFPSYYEPWGYTPLECMASGVPAITSDLAGFGDYILDAMEDPETNGIYVVRRRKHGFYEAANQLADQLFSLVLQSRTDRIQQRYRLEAGAAHFDWRNLTYYYEKSYDLALGRTE